MCYWLTHCVAFFLSRHHRRIQRGTIAFVERSVFHIVLYTIVCLRCINVTWKSLFTVVWTEHCAIGGTRIWYSSKEMTIAQTLRFFLAEPSFLFAFCSSAASPPSSLLFPSSSAFNCASYCSSVVLVTKWSSSKNPGWSGGGADATERNAGTAKISHVACSPVQTHTHTRESQMQSTREWQHWMHYSATQHSVTRCTPQHIFRIRSRSPSPLFT